VLQYFAAHNNDAGKRWILNLFSKNLIAASQLEVNIQKQLIELSADKTLQVEFSFEELDIFWLARKKRISRDGHRSFENINSIRKVMSLQWQQ
jgi:hypothetical protein